MPLKQTDYGGECPLGKFKIDIAKGAGCYDRDPVGACYTCNFSDVSQEKFNLEAICLCPDDMTWRLYDRLMREYSDATPDRTRSGFQVFVKGVLDRNQSKPSA